MSVKDLYRAFVEGKRVKVKIILSGFVEGIVVGMEFKKNKQGQVCTCGVIKDDNDNSLLHAGAENIFLIDNE